MLAYTLCTQDQRACGSSSQFYPTLNWTRVYSDSFQQYLDQACAYQINTDLKDSLYYSTISIVVDYYFASSFMIMYGLDQYNIIKNITPVFNFTYSIPVMSNSRQINTIYVVARPDKQMIEVPQFSFRFKLDATDPYNSSTIQIVTGFNYTDKESYSVDRLQFLVIGGGSFGAIIIFSVLFSWCCTSIQYKYSPPNEFIQENELKQKAWDKAHGIDRDMNQSKGKSKKNAKDDTQSDIEMTST